MSVDMPSTSNSSSSEAHQVPCWACGAVVAPPLTPQGRTAPLFSCGWCGAYSLSEEEQAAARAAHSARRKPGRVTKLARKGFAAFMLIIILSVYGLGVPFVMGPLLGVASLNFALQLALITLVFAGVLGHFAAAASRHAGPVDSCHQSPSQGAGNCSEGRAPPAQGSLAGHVWCLPCGRGKPPKAHHCRVCQTCVMDMDHHCIYIANCVGAGNLRNFLLLLVYILLGCTYALAASLALLWREQGTVKGFWTGTLLPSVLQGGVLDVLLLTNRAIFWAPRWMGAAFFVAGTSLSAGVSLGILLASQLRQLQRGVTYVESLKGGTIKSPQRQSLYAALQPVLGPGPVYAWLVPDGAPWRMRRHGKRAQGQSTSCYSTWDGKESPKKS